MNIYSSDKAFPYVYICTHKETGHFYIGYREANTQPSNIDLPRYKTSSKVVNPTFDDFYWEIIAEFLCGDDAYDFEQQLINEHWYNELLINSVCYYNKQKFKPTIESVIKTKETKLLRHGISTYNNTEKRNKTINDEDWKNTTGKIRANNISESLSKTLNSKEYEQNMKVKTEKRNKTINDEDWKNTTGKEMATKISQIQHSEEWKIKNYKTCEHCNKWLSPGNYSRHHGNKCKNKI
jgi:hypothetical protein